MNILIVGEGGREHSLAWKISDSPLIENLYCAPGNGGTAEIAQNIDINSSDYNGLLKFAKKNQIDLTVIGPEAPLVGGLGNLFEQEGLKIFGPGQKAAQLEGSKSFAKKIMLEAGVPTGKAEVFTDFEKASSYLSGLDAPIVVKADGLAAGKGVTVAKSINEAQNALEECFLKQKFGVAGQKVLIEEFLAGQEISVLVFTDGKEFLPMEPAQDHKAIYDNDKGPNTGGMGAYSPVPFVSKELFNQIINDVFKPLMKELQNREIGYRGVIYGGLILTDNGPKVLEFNVRFGDPETQALLPRLESDLIEIMKATIEGKLADYKLKWSPEKCLTVVASSQGYPARYQIGFPIKGIKAANKVEGAVIFQAGTALRNGQLLTNGGRVINASAKGKDFHQAKDRAYNALNKIDYSGIYYRRDIGDKAIAL